jgi:polysaccharide biosynthesis transport protein
VMSVGLFLGLFTGIGLALAIDSLDDTIRASMDVEDVTRLPVLAAVPHIAVSQAKRSSSTTDLDLPRTGPSMKLPALSDPQSVGAESYRQLRTSVLLSFLDAPPRVILISSAHVAEGKSMTSANYALALALHGSSVLLIDADLRRGTLHRIFEIRNTPGLTNALSGTLREDEFCRPVPDVPNLAVLPTGARPPNASEVLSSKRMADFLATCLRSFDYIILDSAPILPVADSHALAARADAVILIARAAVTRKKAILRVKELLSRAHSKLIGIVVNDVNLRVETYYIYGGGYGYDYPYKSADRE